MVFLHANGEHVETKIKVIIPLPITLKKMRLLDISLIKNYTLQMLFSLLFKVSLLNYSASRQFS